MDREAVKGRFTTTSVLALVAGLHIAALLMITVTTGTREVRDDADVFKLVDVREYVPPVPPPSPPKPPPKPKEEVVETPPQDTVAEIIIETEKVVIETPSEAPPSPVIQPREPEYLPQHKISTAPGIPRDLLRKNIIYPPLANRQGIEGVVILELFIDREGVIRKIDVLSDPGYGFAEAAVAAFRGITCTPAEAKGEGEAAGQPVAVRYRYPIRFQLR